MNRRSSAVLQLRPIGNPPLAGEHRDTQDRCEDDLRETRVDDRQPVMQKLPHDLASENRLRDHSANGSHPKPAHPRPRVLFPQPNRQKQHEKTITAAITRCECSKNAPLPTFLGMGTKFQRISASPVPRERHLWSNKRPGDEEEDVQQTVNTANLCTPGWYVVVIDPVPAPDYTFNSLPWKGRPPGSLTGINPHGVQYELLQRCDK